MTQKADIAVIGLAVMGQNLILNIGDHGIGVVAFNRTTSKVEGFLNGPAKGNNNIVGAFSLDEMVSLLRTPRKVMLMVKAGEVVDDFIEKLLPLLDEGDIIIDGGNSNFTDSVRRNDWLAEKGILFVGTGISGGEEGARKGPSIMPGGNEKAWPLIKDIYQKIAAKTEDGTPCCDWVGESGSGHFVKMVHNGIEYGDMQLICEAYHVMRGILRITPSEISEVFTEWDTGELKSYLIEITANILSHTDDDGEPLIDKILDTAGQKGTGKWTGINSLNLGVPLTLITEAVYARALSSFKEERVEASNILKGPEVPDIQDKELFINDIRDALFASKIVSYTQGFMLMQHAAKVYNWSLDFGSIALLWREGCIIRSVFLNKIKEAYAKNHDLKSLLLDDYFREIVDKSQKAWRRVVAMSVAAGVPVPTFASALSFFDGYRTDRLPANLLQAQRDYFGAHTYERIDKPRGEFFHTNWTGAGGDVSSTTYSV